MTVDPGTAISVSDRFAVFFTCNRHRMLFFAGIELEHVV